METGLAVALLSQASSLQLEAKAPLGAPIEVELQRSESQDSVPARAVRWGRGSLLPSAGSISELRNRNQTR